MSSVVPFRPAGQPTYDTKMLALIKRTVAAETTDDEFSLFIHMARSLNLDPLRRQIYAFVFSKDDVKKRRMSIVTAIDGFRAIADRTGNYRPDEDEPTYEVDGVIHYCVANMPGAVPNTSTWALTNATLPYAVQIANKGWRKACTDNYPLALGLNTVGGAITCAGVSAAFGDLPSVSLRSVLD